MVKIGYITHKNKRKQMKNNENEKTPISEEILFIYGLIEIVFFSFMTIKSCYHLTMYPRYTIAYVDKHVHNRDTDLFFYVNGIRYNVSRSNLLRPDTRYYVKFSSKNPDINSVRDRVPDFIHKPPTDGWEREPTYEYGNEVYDYNGKYLGKIKPYVPYQ